MASNSAGHRRLHLTLEVGHESEYLGPVTPKSPRSYSHKWCLFLRSTGEKPLDATFVQQVAFHLHESFIPPTRILKAPPYEVKENGYGGFTVGIKISFVGCEKEYSIQYDLDLALSNERATHCVSRVLEFIDPGPELKAALMSHGAQPKHSTKKPPQSFENLFGPTLALQHQEKPAAKKLDLPTSNSSATTKEKTPNNASHTNRGKTNAKPGSKSVGKSPVRSSGKGAKGIKSPSSSKKDPEKAPAKIGEDKKKAENKKEKVEDKVDPVIRNLKPEKARANSASPFRKKDAEPTDDGLNIDILTSLVKAIGGNEKDAEVLSSQHTPARSMSPLFQTESPEPVPSPNAADVILLDDGSEGKKKKKKKHKTKDEWSWDEEGKKSKKKKKKSSKKDDSSPSSSSKDPLEEIEIKSEQKKEIISTTIKVPKIKIHELPPIKQESSPKKLTKEEIKVEEPTEIGTKDKKRRTELEPELGSPSERKKSKKSPKIEPNLLEHSKTPTDREPSPVKPKKSPKVNAEPTSSTKKDEATEKLNPPTPKRKALSPVSVSIPETPWSEEAGKGPSSDSSFSSLSSTDPIKSFPLPPKSGAKSKITDPIFVETLKGLQRKIMTLTESSKAQRVADIVCHENSFRIRDNWLEFDLFSLPKSTIAQLSKCFE